MNTNTHTHVPSATALAPVTRATAPSVRATAPATDPARATAPSVQAVPTTRATAPTTRARRRPGLLLLLAALSVLSLVAAACGGDSDDSSATPADQTAAPSESPAASKGSLNMGRANWTTGYFQAALLRNLVEQLGYEVTDPAEFELGPSLAYLAMAQGDIDFWANSWFPLHHSWMMNEMPDGSLVGDHIQSIGGLLAQSALQGYFMTKSFADEFGVATLDDLNNNPDALAEYDKHDATPGNGIAEIYGCPESWTCDDAIQNQIAFSGWENIVQVRVGYDAMFAESLRLINDGLPTVVYSWTPSAYVLQLQPGVLTIWAGVEDVLDDSNPLGLDGGEGLDQRPGTLTDLNADECPSLDADSGECKVGWGVADIIVSARNDLIAESPELAKLFEVVELNVIDVSEQILAQENGASIDDLVAQWLVDNAELAEGWLAEARAVAGAA